MEAPQLEDDCIVQTTIKIAWETKSSKNASHTLAYSLVGLQEMNLAYKYPIIYWNTACLITDSGGTDSDEDNSKNNNYDKIAIAIGKMTSAGIAIQLPDINKSKYTFTPKEDENKIYFGLRGMLNIGDDLISDIINNRPYASPKDFFERIKPKKQSMISLIKGGAFDSMEDRKFVMAWYIWETCDKKSRLTLQNMPGLIKYGLLPEVTPEQILSRRVYEFNRYLKAICKQPDGNYRPDERAMNFLIELHQENLVDPNGILSAKVWDKIVYQKHMNVFRSWLNENKEQILKSLNERIFKEDWDKYASGNLSSWEMEVLCFYYHEHELKNVNRAKYGISNFFDLPAAPVIDKTFRKGDKEIHIFKLTRICGTCIAKNKAKGTVTLLTPEGVVNVLYPKEYFALFDRQISVIQEDGTKKIVEKSWFNRGNMIIVHGMRRGNDFVSKKYASMQNVHQLYRIEGIDEAGNLTLQSERYKGGIEEDVPD